VNPDDPCLCKHERKWHNSCSKCPCPVFVSKDAKAADVKLWKQFNDVATEAAKVRPQYKPFEELIGG
jgi:hypothetical protein